MIDQRNRSQLQISDLHTDSLHQEDLKWYDYDPDAQSQIEKFQLGKLKIFNVH